MAEEKNANESFSKYLGKIFDGRTAKGRAHVAMATYAVLGGIIFYFMTRPPRPPKQPVTEEDMECVDFSTYNLPSSKV
ncbi:hypothetical protein WA026_018104 [Henosepilachna vigintioctopunctata]|uniref:Uncharacterized protein n=1 Tax=Henosepilachna vigintioctopunctata TaxID=420089 RepID=A0AAW1ULD0_9CUCU